MNNKTLRLNFQFIGTTGTRGQVKYHYEGNNQTNPKCKEGILQNNLKNSLSQDKYF